MRIAVLALATFAVVPTARAQHAAPASQRTIATTLAALASTDDALAVTVSGWSADAVGELAEIDDTDRVDARALRCVARQYGELVRATADPAVLDAFAELAHGALELGYLDITRLGFDPLDRDRRFDYGVTVSDAGVSLKALLRRGGCTIATAPQIAAQLRELRDDVRAAPDVLAAATRTMITRIRARTPASR